MPAAGAGTYRLGFKAAQRGSWQASYQDFAVLLDGVEVARFRPAGTAYQALAVDLSLDAGSHTLTFRGVNSAGGDNTAFVDDVKFSAR